MAAAVIAGLAGPAALMAGTAPSQAAMDRPTAAGPTDRVLPRTQPLTSQLGTDEDAGTTVTDPDADELPRRLAGVRRSKRAISALGPHIRVAASRNGMSVRQLTTLLRQDRSV